MGKIFSDLNLNGESPVRVQPALGQWGPSRVPTPGQRKATRWKVAGYFVSAVIALFALGYYFYKILMGIA